MENIFKLKEHGSTPRRELMGGVITFLSMAYIILVNPMYLSMTGMDYTAVLLATCLSSAVGCLLTAFIANVPFAQAPSMGLNTFFTYTIVMGMGYTWQQGLAIVFISGILFLIFTLSPLRTQLISSIPAFLKNAISAGVGMFTALIGMFHVGIVTAHGDGTAGAYTDLGAITHGQALLAVIGLTITIILLMRKVKGSIFIGMVVTTLIGIPMGLTTFTWTPVNFSAIRETFFQLDFIGLTSVSGGVLALVTAVLSFFIVDCFDTAGTLVGCSASAGMLSEKGEMPRGDKAMIADAIATCTGAILGTPTVTTYAESSTGIAEGARTGLSTAIVGVLFLLSCFIAPVAGVIPSAAVAPALIIVGVRMMAGTSKINWRDLEQAIPAFLTIIMMPFAYSIADGIGFGFISFCLIKVCRGKAKEVNLLVYAIAALFLVTYVLFGL